MHCFNRLPSSVVCGIVASRLLALSVRSSAIAPGPAHSMDSAADAAALVTMPGSAPTPHAHETRDSAANPPGSASASAAADAVPDPPPRCSASAGATVPVADPHNPGDAPAGQDAEMSDEEYIPSSDEDSVGSSMDTVPASGARDDEVVLAVSSSSTSDSPRRRPECRRRTVSSAVTPELYDMDTSAEEVPGHKQFKTFRGVWEDRVSWEEVRSKKSRYRVVLTPQEPSSTSFSLPNIFLLPLLLRYLRLPLFPLPFLPMALLSILCKPLYS